MRVLCVHPGPLMHSEVFLGLEPLGLERVAGAARAAGHEVRVIDLQMFSHGELERELHAFAPDEGGFGLNYLANVPEVRETRADVLLRNRDVFDRWRRLGLTYMWPWSSSASMPRTALYRKRVSTGARGRPTGHNV